MIDTTQEVNTQFFIILIVDFEKSFHTSLSISCDSKKLVDHLYDHFQVPHDRRKSISIETLGKWLNDENIIIDIFNSKGNQIFPRSSGEMQYPTKYVVHDKSGNIAQILPEKFALIEYSIKHKSNWTDSLNFHSHIQRAYEKIWENNARWSLIRLADTEPFYVTALNLN